MELRHNYATKTKNSVQIKQQCFEQRINWPEVGKIWLRNETILTTYGQTSGADYLSANRIIQQLRTTAYAFALTFRECNASRALEPAQRKVGTPCAVSEERTRHEQPDLLQTAKRSRLVEFAAWRAIK